MKITLIGVGSFVFGPSAINDAIIDSAFADLHLALVDKNLAMAQLMAGVARRMARDVGKKVRVTVHSEWTDALDGSDFVLCSAAVQLHQRFLTDVQIIQRIYPEHLITEFGGVAGISYSLRQIAMIRQLAADIARQCPNAWLLVSSNPLPRVCQAAHQAGVRTAGFCSNSLGGFTAIGRVMQGWNEQFPWPKTTARYQAVMAGPNHFTFMLELLDLATGQNVTADFTKAALATTGLPPGIQRQLMEETGYYPPNGDVHMHDFLPPTPYTQSMSATSHGSDSERQQRINLLQKVADGTSPIAAALDHRAWERPIDFAAALAGGKPIRLNSLNLANTGQIANLPSGVFVETPVIVSSGRIDPQQISLPASILKYAKPTVDLHNVITQAAITRSRAALKAAVEQDPTIVDKSRGWQAMEECLRVHQDLIGM